MSRTAVQPARLTLGEVATRILTVVFFVVLLLALAPLAMNTLAEFGIIRPGAFKAPPAEIKTIAIPTLSLPARVPPAVSPVPPQAPLRVNSAPAIALPVSAATPAPVPVGIKVIVVKPSSGAPIVIRDGKKYRGAP